MSTRILVGDVREKVPELERGRYRVVLADPPWRFSTWSAKGELSDLDRMSDRYREGLAEIKRRQAANRADRDEELATRSAPRWAWQAIGHSGHMPAKTTPPMSRIEPDY